MSSQLELQVLRVQKESDDWREDLLARKREDKREYRHFKRSGHGSLNTRRNHEISTLTFDSHVLLVDPSRPYDQPSLTRAHASASASE